jgi:8-oxo-dGTP diphosphatase
MSGSTPNTAVDPEPTAPPRIAVGILQDSSGRVLVARRPEGVPAGGLWEFPGGKCEPGETVEAALARELAEEVGVTPTRVEPLLNQPARHGAPPLHFRRVTSWRGTPSGREGQPTAWVTPDELDEWPMPAANAPVIRALRLPDCYVISPAPDAVSGAEGERFLATLQSVAAGGMMLQLRAPDLGANAYRALAVEALSRVRAVGGRLLLNADPELAVELGADGVHLPGRCLARLEGRPLELGMLVGASCHGPEELARAVEHDLDFAVLSPVHATASHPKAPPLGWTRFGDWVAATPLPVYALGGVGPDDLERARAHGARGVAGIRAFWPTKPPVDGETL